MEAEMMNPDSNVPVGALEAIFQNGTHSSHRRCSQQSQTMHVLQSLCEREKSCSWKRID